jgi:starvation-inducible DNA-binding protein
LKRLTKKALNTVLQDSFKQDVEKAQHLQEVVPQPMDGHPPVHPPISMDAHDEMLPDDAEEVDKEHDVDNDGMGFDETPIEEALLNDICSMQVLYQQVKFFHWIATGENYIASHRFFDEVAEAILNQIDLLAERLVFLGINPIAEMEEIADRSYVEFTQMDNAFKFDGAISIIDEALEKVIDNLKNNVMKAGDSKNIGTEKMLQDFVYDLEVLQHHIRSFK